MGSRIQDCLGFPYMGGADLMNTRLFFYRGGVMNDPLKFLIARNNFLLSRNVEEKEAVNVSIASFE